ncbi:hypothetical protein ACFSUS_20695 [Spirosoma soli]|uniref:Galactose oxidase n=1 Tax=Spirosoma soli TaxID=1770529 RepID=A0ABW5M7X1_9BACT
MTDHINPPISLKSAPLVPPTTSGPSGQAYAMQVGTRCFLLDQQQTFWQYDPVTRSYTARTPPPELPNFDNSGFAAVKLFAFSSSDKIYFGGQSIIAVPGTNDFPVFLYVYNPATDSWASSNPLPGNGTPYPEAQISFFANGKGYVCSFVTEIVNGALSNTYKVYCSEYDPGKSQWTKRFDTPLLLPPGLTYGTPSQAVVIDGKAYWVVNAYPTAKIGKSLSSEDGFACVYELNPQTNELVLKLTTNPFGSGMAVAPYFRLGLSAANKLWLLNEGSFDQGNPVANQLFWYDPATNQLNRTSVSLLIAPNKSLSWSVGYAIDNHLYIGLGEYGFVNGTPAGLENGFAEFNVK